MVMETNFADAKMLLAEDNPADVALIREAISEAELQCALQVLRGRRRGHAKH